MIKSLVDRVSGKAGSGDSGATQHPSAPKESSHQADRAAKPDAQGETGESSGKGRQRRRPRKPKDAPAPWSLDDFPVDPKDGEVRFHDLGLRDVDGNALDTFSIMAGRDVRFTGGMGDDDALFGSMFCRHPVIADAKG